MEVEAKKPVAIPNKNTEIRIYAITDCAGQKMMIPLEVNAVLSAPSLMASIAQEGSMEK
jgi:hypothetical protein